MKAATIVGPREGANTVRRTYGLPHYKHEALPVVQREVDPLASMRARIEGLEARGERGAAKVLRRKLADVLNLTRKQV